ncbi:hypothetical protein D9M68_781530 [compost metagenome]
MLEATNSWETHAPSMTTHTTRTYCIHATRRPSEPPSSAMAIIAEAAPGAVPQAEASAGIRLKQARPRPTPALSNMVSAVTSSIRYQSLLRAISTPSVTDLATIRPTSPWPERNKILGTWIPAPAAPIHIATSIGPKSGAAGSPALCSRKLASPPAPTRTAHCKSC